MTQPSGAAGADSEHGQRNDAQDGQHGNDETPFLTKHAEHDVGIRGREIREPALAGTDADHAAGGGCGQRMRLLEALVVHVLPDMSPGGKSCGNVRLDGQHDHARAEAAGAHKADGGEIA